MEPSLEQRIKDITTYLATRIESLEKDFKHIGLKITNVEMDRTTYSPPGDIKAVQINFTSLIKTNE